MEDGTSVPRIRVSFFVWRYFDKARLCSLWKNPADNNSRQRLPFMAVVKRKRSWVNATDEILEAEFWKPFGKNQVQNRYE